MTVLSFYLAFIIVFYATLGSEEIDVREGNWWDGILIWISSEGNGGIEEGS